MSRLIVVGGLRREPAFHCRVPTGPEEVCGAVFFEEEQRKFAQHVKECARKHEREIAEASPRVQQPLWHTDDDPEVAAHMKRVGERMLEEGRLVTKPNEKAGF
jgi:hypothetical protein